MLVSIVKDLWKTRKESKRRGYAPGLGQSSSQGKAVPGWRVYGDAMALQTTFDVAVIMTTEGRTSFREALQSVYAQAFPGRIQLLIGLGAPLESFDEHERLFRAAPPNITVCSYNPGYSLSARHGGLYVADDGGVLRAVLTYIANSRYVTHLDEDNWWNPVHLQSLHACMAGKVWANSGRWLVDPHTRAVIGADDWGSVGSGRDLFADASGGWMDTNCIMYDKLACEPAIRCWTIPNAGDENAMSADRHINDCLRQRGDPGVTGLITTYCALQADDPMQSYRLQIMEAHEPPEVTANDRALSRSDTDIDFSFLLPTRGRISGLSALLSSIQAMTARPDKLEIILGIDEDDEATRDFVWDGLSISKVIVPPGLSMGRLNQACFKASRGRYLMAMNDDVLLRTPQWDDKIRLALEAVRDEIFLVHVNDLLFGQKLCCFPLVSRTFCEIGEGFCPDEYERYRIDDHIHDVFTLLSAHGHHRVFYLPDVVFEHLNYVPGQMGERLYPLNSEILRRDALRFTESKAVRHALAETLARWIARSGEQRISEMAKKMGGSRGVASEPVA